MEKDKAGNLVPIRLKIPVDALNKPDFLQLLKDAQCCGLATIRFPADHGYCRVTLTVITPEAQKVKNGIALLSSEVHDVLETAANSLEVFEKQTPGEDGGRW